jgi:site-specific recombinase
VNENWKPRLHHFRQFFKPAPFQTGLFEVLAEMQGIESREDRASWIENLGHWLSKDSDSPQRYVRFKFLFQQLEKDAAVKANFANQVRLLFDEISTLRFFLQTGFADQTGLLQEIGTRFLSSILPTLRENDFFEISREVIRSEKELNWFKQIPKDTFEQLCRLLPEKDALGIRITLNSTTSEALLVISARLASFGLTSEIRARANHILPSESPFLKLQIEIQNVLKKGPGSQSLDNEVISLMSSCHQLISHVYGDMEQNGTSVGLVYRLEAMTAALERIRLLLEILKPVSEALDLQKVHELFSGAAEGTYKGQSIIGHVRQQTHLLSRKIAERNGESGDHYIARDRTERRILFVSALKGGAIVVAMTALKMTLHSWHLPALFEALMIWFIYTLGFLVMQFTDSTLATKLPSFTASKLARMMATARKTTGLQAMASELREVVLSQSLAFIGNIVMVIPLAMALEAGVSWAFASARDPRGATSIREFGGVFRDDDGAIFVAFEPSRRLV